MPAVRPRPGMLRGLLSFGSMTMVSRVFGLLRADWEASPLREVPVEIAGDPPATFVVS